MKISDYVFLNHTLQKQSQYKETYTEDNFPNPDSASLSHSIYRGNRNIYNAHIENVQGN